MKRTASSKILLVIAASVLLGTGCSQASTQSAAVNNTVIQIASPLTTSTPTNQASSLSNATSSVNAGSKLQNADQGKVQRVQFTRGRNSATFKDVVYQNKDNEYLLEAKVGQTMTISMNVEKSSKSPDSNYDVALQIFKPNTSEPFAELENRVWRGQLPETGEYKIRLTSMTESNGYTLKIAIK